MSLLQALAVPALGLLGRAATIRGTGRLRSKIEALQKVHDSAPTEGRAPLAALIVELIQELTRLEHRRLTRKVDMGAVFALVFVAVVGGAAFAGGWAYGTWWSISLGAAVGLFTILLMAAGATTLFKYPDN